MIEIRAYVLPLIDNQLGRAMSNAIESGWEILYPPQYLYTALAAGYNVHRSEHFLIVAKREIPTATERT